MVVAVAMLGSLTALPAALALLGRHVDKGRIRVPFRRRAARRQESRIWGAVLTRVLRRPAAAAALSLAILLAIASPALHFRVHNTGINDLPPGLPGIAVLKHVEKAFPSTDTPATVVITADQPATRPSARRSPISSGGRSQAAPCISRSTSPGTRPAPSRCCRCRWPATAPTRPRSRR
jgi:RND superfamily putative drug exporter